MTDETSTCVSRPKRFMHIRLTLFGQTTWVHLIKILFMRPVPSFHLLVRAGVTGGGGIKTPPPVLYSVYGSFLNTI